MSVKIVTDSSAKMPPELLLRYDIRAKPLHLLVDGVDIADVSADYDLAVLQSTDVTTAGLTPDELRDIYSQALTDSDGDGVVAVHLSRKFSNTWNSARVASEEFGNKIRVVDSKTVGLGVTLAVLGAAQASSRGEDRDRVYESAISVSTTTASMICVPSLDNLRRSGRIGATTKLFGSALAIKPVLRIVDGALVLSEKQRTMSKAVDKMLASAIEHGRGRPMTVAVQHVHAEEAAQELAETIAKKMTIKNILVTELGPVLGVHIGAGALGLSLCPALDQWDN